MPTTSGCLSGVNDVRQKRCVQTKAQRLKDDLQQFLSNVIDKKVDFQSQKGAIKKYLKPLYEGRRRIAPNFLKYLYLIFSIEDLPLPDSEDLIKIQQGWEKWRYDYNQNPTTFLEQFLSDLQFIPEASGFWSHIYHAFAEEERDNFIQILTTLKKFVRGKYRFYILYLANQSYKDVYDILTNEVIIQFNRDFLEYLNGFDALTFENKVEILKTYSPGFSKENCIKKDYQFFIKLFHRTGVQDVEFFNACTRFINFNTPSGKKRLYIHLDYLLSKMENGNDAVWYLIKNIIISSKLQGRIAKLSYDEVKELNQIVEELIFISVYYTEIHKIFSKRLYNVLLFYLKNKDYALKSLDEVDKLIIGRYYDFKQFPGDVIEYLFFNRKGPKLLFENFDKLQELEFNFLQWILEKKPVREFPELPFKITSKQVYKFFTVFSGNDTPSIDSEVLYTSFLIVRINDIYDSHALLRDLVNRFQEYLRRFEIKFWDDLTRFFKKYENDMRYHEIRDILDYVINQKNNNTNYTLKGRTLNSIRRSMEEWHNQLQILNNLDYYTQSLVLKDNHLDKIQWKGKSYDNFVFEHEGEQYEIIQLNNLLAVFEEGKAMNHCVANYIYDCYRGYTSIWSLRQVKDNKVKRLLTIELKGNNIIQAKGNCNRPPDSFENRIIRNWAHKENLSY
jgi:hypothetical protein